MTLTQLSAFVMVARLRSVKAAANALGVSESAVSQALSALRTHYRDPLVERGAEGMVLTPGGTRLAPIAAQIVKLGAEAESAVGQAKGAPERLRLAAGGELAEFITTPLVEAFTKRLARPVEVEVGVARREQIPALVANRLADVGMAGGLVPAAGVHTEAVFRVELIAVTSPETRSSAEAGELPWLVDPDGLDPEGPTAALLRQLSVPVDRVRVFANQSSAWSAAAQGEGVAPAAAHLVAARIKRGELTEVETPATPLRGSWMLATAPESAHPSIAASFRRFLKTPRAMHVLQRPDAGVPVSRFRPPVHVSIWT